MTPLDYAAERSQVSDVSVNVVPEVAVPLMEMREAITANIMSGATTGGVSLAPMLTSMLEMGKTASEGLQQNGGMSVGR
jgi:hypothetical protein